MKTFFITLGFTTLLLIFSAIGLGIGKLITGRSKLSCKRCGHPEKKDECSICIKREKKK
ncbi:hypothetical protein [Simkania negevensis]|uniref:Uncharacterized protein n=1 Tax=Simkania negevensis (strain ATCC VR-1471 / DSM 27360 / Z) TaxID=331113 RepID=F8L7P4_SIMNZ|nr:hypothetical protein [Simkania negevensis]CCB88780.1 unknown protein [Simkania negevensis Z]